MVGIDVFSVGCLATLIEKPEDLQAELPALIQPMEVVLGRENIIVSGVCGKFFELNIRRELKQDSECNMAVNDVGAVNDGGGIPGTGCHFAHLRKDSVRVSFPQFDSHLGSPSCALQTWAHMQFSLPFCMEIVKLLCWFEPLKFLEEKNHS